MDEIEKGPAQSDHSASTGAEASVAAKVLTESEKLDQQIADLQAKRDAVKATEDLAGHFHNSEGVRHEDAYSIDSALLRSIGGAMEARLRVGAFKGWHGRSVVDLVSDSKDRLDAGAFIDAAIYAAMAQAQQSLAA